MLSDCGALKNDPTGLFTVPSDAGHTFGAKVVLSCKNGYRITGEEATTKEATCESSGNWSLTAITCSKKGTSLR